MEADEPDSTSEYADEGTAAHHVAARCLRDSGDPQTYLGQRVRIVNGVVCDDPRAPLPPLLKGHTEPIAREFEVNEEMVDAVRDYCTRVAGHALLGDLHVEQALPIDHITGEKDATGTGDAIITMRDNPVGDDEIQVHDFKYGVGVKVDACENPQLVMYASGAMRKHPGHYKAVRMFVHQPRLQHFDEWRCTPDELAEHVATLKQAAVVANTAQRYATNWMHEDASAAYLVPGQHCSDGFCKARGSCPALALWVQAQLSADFADITTRPIDAMLPTDPHAVGVAFKAVDMIEDWCKQVRARAERYLFEHNNSPEVIAALGIKLVLGRRGPRRWRDADEAHRVMRHMRLKQTEMYERKLISPTQAEKILAKRPHRWQKVAPLIEQREGQPSVALAADARPALVLAPAINEFNDLTQGDFV